VDLNFSRSLGELLITGRREREEKMGCDSVLGWRVLGLGSGGNYLMHAYMGREEKEESGRGGRASSASPLFLCRVHTPKRKEGMKKDRHEPEGGVMLS